MTGLALPCALVCTGRVNEQIPSSAGKPALNVAPGPQNAGRGCLVHENPIPSRLFSVHSGFNFLALNF